MHLREFFQSLHQHQVRYLICGGVAINLYGIPRATADLDILLDFDENNLENFLECVKEFGYQQGLPISILELSDQQKRMNLIQEKNLIAMSFFSSTFQMVTLDVLVDIPFDFETLWKNRSERNSTQTPLYLVSVEDLVLLKQYSNREQDRLDIESLKKLFPEKF
jgi:hypothetical protein